MRPSAIPRVVYVDVMDRFQHIESSTEVGGTVFPPEIMMDILSRVPAKPLMRFKMVNRAWEALIRDKYFISRVHLPQMKKLNMVGFLIQSQYGLYPLGYRPSSINPARNNRLMCPWDPEVYILGSCNGLELECNSDDDFRLVNPMSGISFMIPNSIITFPVDSTFASVFFGMGYVDAEDVFKIVRICNFNNVAKDTNVSVMSTRNMEWTDLGPFPYSSCAANPGVFAGGCLNWQVKQGNRTICIASFNCREQTFDRIELPVGLDTVNVYGEIGALDDERLVLYSNVCLTFQGLEMWVLDEYKVFNSWVRLIFPAGGIINMEELALGIQPIRLMKPCERSILFRIDPLDMYVIYNMDNGTYEQLLAPVLHEDYCNVFPFVQSIVDPRFLMEQ